ncbi:MULTISPECIES: LysR family transcriptional regulator [unclassified Agarivorans]|uniref:LysR family transcriptional regulator n=1 Tax=unclassified Agarivorans TaxID=2636026 RepID=UPI0026E46D70|nr:MULTISPECIES: LysR family transcriptional regulator [unclassified Agarivorans]MDO6686383.1 LysR family transcriptional regulator [Agarivorans sp. 3_MG-2023]MDO6713685.1 LysR family transcriptional regulator [Agarivorans sp. 2_MG-2023]
MSQSSQFDLNLLRVFKSAYEHESVTRAAEQLDLTQSAVSNALSRLKETIGQELFSRTGRGIKPTPFARDFYSSLQAPLLNIEGLIESVQDFTPTTSSRQFNVYCHEAMFHKLRQKLDIALKDSAIDVMLIELPSDEQKIYEDLSNESVDVVIDVCAPESLTFNSLVIQRDKLCCIANRSHPRLQSGALTQAAYLAEQHAMFDMRRFDLTFVDWITDEVLPRRKAYSEHKSLMGMIAAISYSDAVGVVPCSLAQQYSEVFNLQLMDFPFKTQSFDSYLVSLSKMQTNPANQWLRTLLIGQV